MAVDDKKRYEDEMAAYEMALAEKSQDLFGKWYFFYWISSLFCVSESNLLSLADKWFIWFMVYCRMQGSADSKRKGQIH